VAGYRSRYSGPASARSGKFAGMRQALARVFRRGSRGSARPTQAAVLGRQENSGPGRFYRDAVMFLLLFLVIGSAGRLTYQVLDRSDIFRLTSITIQGNRLLSRTELLDLGGIGKGVSLLSLDTEAVRQRLEQHPWIRTAEVTPDWPSTLVVRVGEYRPMAMVNVEDGQESSLYYIDRHGTIFAKVNGYADLDFPVLTGLRTEGAPLGAVISDKGLAAEAFRFLRLAARGNPIVPLQSISEVHISAENGLVVYLVDRPFPIYMGSTDIKRRYYLLVKLMERLYRRKKVEEIKEIRMDYGQDRILVARLEP